MLGVVLGQRSDYFPPQRVLHADGSRAERDFVLFGELIKHFLIGQGLTPNQSILEIGSITGRLALALADYLKEGYYDGLHIGAGGVEWCQKHLSRKYRHLRFNKFDLYNKVLNPSGKYKPAQLRLPYEDSTFNAVVIISVFEHILPRDLESYFGEIRRVLKPDGKYFANFYALNEESTRYLEIPQSSRPGQLVLKLPFEYGPGCRVADKDVPERIIAHDEGFIRYLCEKHGLSIKEINYGSWCGRTNKPSFQDLAIGVKEF
jgi:SAM-dependent methyltransferase